MTLKDKLLWQLMPVLILLLLYQLLECEANLKSVRIEEIPFGLSTNTRNKATRTPERSSGIHAISQLEQSRQFFHLFNVPYIVCFFAAKGKWPIIPPMMQPRVDEMSRTFFSKNDSHIRQFCQKWIQIKECFRPIFGPTTPPTELEALRANTPCVCATPSSVVYFDKNYIGNVSSETIHNTIEFLESFLPAPTKKFKHKRPKIGSRLDEMDID